MLCLKTMSVLFVLLFLLKNNKVENMTPMMTEMKFVDVSDKKAGSSISESNSKKDNYVDEKSSTNNVQKSESTEEDVKKSSSGGGLDDNLLFLIIAGIMVYFLSGKDFLR
jgi:hypothetical protein